ncbi:MAG: hypothetical protein K2X77_06885 [Candidatus Obscuribacterales bacterium]|jgi:hypothetical protein|nr:hypothetical protein [Candidatus Obscuribacterales bacterium]
MYSLVLFGSLGIFVFGFFALRIDGDEKALNKWVKWFFFGFFTGLGALVGLMIGLAVGSIIGFAIEKVEDRRESITLVAMRGAEGHSGTFILGSGSIRNGHFYRFYVRNDDGSLTPGGLEADRLVRVIEDASLKDRGYWTTIVRVRNPNSVLFDWSVGDVEIVAQEFRVPAGTVRQSFQLD